MVPVDLLDILKHTWQVIGCQYDVTTGLPNMRCLFDGTNLSNPAQASEIVVANMICEIIECLGRFSPWYKKPAETFGLALSQDCATQHVRWGLSPTAVRQWRDCLQQISIAIERNIGLILSASLIDDLERAQLDSDPCVMASCLCLPPRVILVSRSILVGSEIKCDACQQPFAQIDDVPGVDGWAR